MQGIIQEENRKEPSAQDMRQSLLPSEGEEDTLLCIKQTVKSRCSSLLSSKTKVAETCKKHEVLKMERTCCFLMGIILMGKQPGAGYSGQVLPVGVTYSIRCGKTKHKMGFWDYKRRPTGSYSHKTP